MKFTLIFSGLEDAGEEDAGVGELRFNEPGSSALIFAYGPVPETNYSPLDRLFF